MPTKWEVTNEDGLGVSQEPPLPDETGADASGSGGLGGCIDEVSGETYFVNSVSGNQGGKKIIR